MRSSRTRRQPRTSATDPFKIKVILVKWEDATHQDDESEPIGTMLAWTVGFQIHATEKEVALCMELFEDGDKKAITTIPMGMVRSMRTLATIPVGVHGK